MRLPGRGWHAGPDHDFGSGGKAEGLMAEADAEHRDFGIEDAEDFHAVSGVLGMAGAGGEAHHVQGRVLRQFEQPGMVAFDDHGISARARGESLHEVVGERVVVIDRAGTWSSPVVLSTVRMMADLL